MKDGPYSAILADPPWHYDDSANAGKRGAVHKYPVMTEDAIMDLPVRTLAAKDCVLFLWATMPKLQEALAVGAAWGFTYKTCAFTWVKVARNGTYRIGMGRWSRSNAELVLLFVKGKPQRVDTGVNQIVATIPGRHSEKPDEVRQRIVRLCGDVPRIELFARQRAEGWDSWGPHEGLNDVALVESRLVGSRFVNLAQRRAA